MNKFDFEDKKQRLEHRDSGGQIIKVGDIALYSISSTRMALVNVTKLCPTVIKIHHKANDIPKGFNNTDASDRKDRSWDAQVWSSALYILKRDEENNI